MKFYKLKQQLSPLIVFSMKDIRTLDPNFRQATLYDWEKAQKVTKLKNNAYIFNDFNPHDTDFYLLSNELYQPSYISTELALNHYGIIPEAIVAITAVTTNKTHIFTTPIAIFMYQTLKKELFFGYNLFQVRNHGVMIASLEKSILDYLYLNPQINSLDDFRGLRWNKDELITQLNLQLLDKYLKIFSSEALAKRIHQLKKYIEK